VGRPSGGGGGATAVRAAELSRPEAHVEMVFDAGARNGHTDDRAGRPMPALGLASRTGSTARSEEPSPRPLPCPAMRTTVLRTSSCSRRARKCRWRWPRERGSLSGDRRSRCEHALLGARRAPAAGEPRRGLAALRPRPGRGRGSLDAGLGSLRGRRRGGDRHAYVRGIWPLKELVRTLGFTPDAATALAGRRVVAARGSATKEEAR
jgi:hypothetical protein